jgi:hypothetical protein
MRSVPYLAREWHGHQLPGGQCVDIRDHLADLHDGADRRGHNPAAGAQAGRPETKITAGAVAAPDEQEDMMINVVFTTADSFIHLLSDISGLSYEAVNVYIFIVIWPIFTMALIATVFIQQRVIRRLKSQHPSV